MRRRRSGADDAVTLFPFLAVLICTMGSLIVLLVVMVQQAKTTATDRSRERVERQKVMAEETGEVQRQVEDLRWRIKVLEGSREKTAQDLKDRETELSYIEDEIRQSRARLDRAAAEAAQIEQLASQESEQQQSARDELARLHEQLDYAHEALDQARRRFNEGERSYALVPYNGNNGTRRRPIYIECTADRVILQPEGIELYSEDFREPMTDDNALASALRAEREYFADATLQREEPPYPLIIVRPDGAHAYAAARAAMEAWDAEFGYELVDEKMKLAFPDVDASLVDVVREAVEEARARRRMLQSIAPARFGRRPSTLTASPSGGFVAQHSSRGTNRGSRRTHHVGASRAGGGSPFDPPTHDTTGSHPSAHANGIGGIGDPRNSRLGSATNAPGQIPASGFGAMAGAEGPGAGRFDGTQDGPYTNDAGRQGSHDAESSSAAGQFGSGQYGSGQFGSGQYGSGQNITGQNETGRAAAEQLGQRNSSAGSRDPNGASGRSTDSASSGRDGNQGGTAAGSSNANGQRGGKKAGANTPSSSSSASSGGSGSSSSGSAGSSGARAAPGGFGASSFTDNQSSLARSRGQDWGLPNRAAGATGITRPIRVTCYEDRLIVFPEDPRTGRADTLSLDGPLSDEVDQLVSRIWQRMDSWGIAGSRMYWKPVLQIQVQAGADARYAELVQLLQDSGIVVKRK